MTCCALIRYRYGLLLSWQGEKLRFLLPTTIAPRYGDASQAGLEAHQIPTASLEVKYPLHLEVSIEGSLANAQITSPSHALSVTRTESGVLVQLSGKAVLDRDFVLTVQKPEAQSACILTTDGDAHVALASVCIAFDWTP